jgi:hypothetical protein
MEPHGLDVRCLDQRKIDQAASAISKKVLVQVEGATCSGKTSLILDVHRILDQKGISAMILEEAATTVFKENKGILMKLCTCATNSSEWIETKEELQGKVLLEQICSLERFAADNYYAVALMDRGGASTAFHTLPFVLNKKKNSVEKICQKMSNLAQEVILLHPLGFLQKDATRYQQNYSEVLCEADGIRSFLDKWKIRFSEISLNDRFERARIAAKLITERSHKRGHLNEFDSL